jgi:hypothetical protein
VPSKNASTSHGTRDVNPIELEGQSVPNLAEQLRLCINLETEGVTEKIERQAPKALDHLHQILDAGERAVCGCVCHCEQPALKLLFKKYPRQRADFNGELAKRFRKPEAVFHSRIQALSMIHRGRLNIFAAMTIGDQNQARVVLNEVRVGERAALRAYEESLKKLLPTDIKGLLERQYKSVTAVVEPAQLMHGVDGR